MVPDPIFADPRLAALYDPFDGDRDDLGPYLALATELGAESVLDVGCGTGTYASASRGRPRGHGVDPAQASLDVAKTKPGAALVRGSMRMRRPCRPLAVDLATMTGNVAQVFLTDDDWSAALRGVRGALRPGGYLVFEVRDPSKEAWLSWDRAHPTASWRSRVPGRSRNGSTSPVSTSHWCRSGTATVSRPGRRSSPTRPCDSASAPRSRQLSWLRVSAWRRA